MKTIAVIPARMGSSRFPGKPLATILGRTMIEHIYKRVSMSKSLEATYIATCDEEIKQAAQNFGAPVIIVLVNGPIFSDSLKRQKSSDDTKG